MDSPSSSPPSWLGPTPRFAGPARRKLGRALGVSIAAHAGFLLLLVIAVSVSTPVDTKTPAVKLDAV